MRVILTCILAASAMVAGFRWYLLVSVAQEAAAKFDVSWTSAFQMDSPAFWPAFWESVRQLRNPSYLFYVCGTFTVLILAGALALVAYFWRSTRFPSSSKKNSLVSASLVILPAIVGLALVPGAIGRNSQALAQAGLSSPEIVATGVGEAFAPFVLGLSLSLLLGGVCSYVWLRRSRVTSGSDV